MSTRARCAWIVAGLLFALYPALRPYADETTLDGLASMASPWWVVSHLFGTAAFVLLAVAVANSLRPGAKVVAVTAVALVLPYYGGETYALHAIGPYAQRTGDLGLLAVVDGFRYQPVAIALFGAGLVLLAVLGVLVAAAWRHRKGVARVAAIMVGLGLLTYLPQFFAPPEVRVLHGVALALGCIIAGLPDVGSKPQVATAGRAAELSAAGAPPGDRRCRS